MTISKPQSRSQRDLQILSAILALILVSLWLFGERQHEPPIGYSSLKNKTVVAKKQPKPQNEGRIREVRIDYYFNELRFAKNSVEAEMIEAKLYNEMSVAKMASVNLMLEGAASLEQEGDFARALQLYQSAQEIEPGFSESYARAGAIAYRLGDKSLALSMTQKALLYEPRHFAAWFGLGTLYEEMGDLPKAREAFSKALYFYPNFSDAERAIFRIDTKLLGIGL